MVKFETRSIEEAKAALKELSLPEMHEYMTNCGYDVVRGRIFGDKPRFEHHLRSHELALLTIQKTGSSHKGFYRSPNAKKQPILQVGMHIGAILYDGSLIISDATQEGNLVRPAQLSLGNLIGYETLKTF